MRWNKILATGTLALIGSLGLACTSIVGADFDRNFGSGGSASASASTSTSTSTSTSSGATSSTGTGTGGSATNDVCTGQTGPEKVPITVFVAPGAIDPPPMGTGAADFFMTRGTTPPAGQWKPLPGGTFFLHASKEGLANPTLLQDCLVANTVHKMMAGMPLDSKCECLGYAVGSSVGQNMQHTPLIQLTNATHSADAVIPIAAMENCALYGFASMCVPTEYYAPL